ncbi:MAG: alpha/beta fold hydrolase [Bacteroidetes bacterium]|nr:alpha/beta fold hydrolase [Bacteroidota bacterium]
MQNTTYVFVPGSFHGAWCWFKMQPLLSKNGNTSIAIDLPAHGRDTTPISAVTLDSYVDAVCRVIEQCNEPVVLIGHSRAGIVISQVAERIPHKISNLVYLCAFLIPDGEPMIATALSDTASLLVSNLILNEAEGWHFPQLSQCREIFYHDCTEEDVALCNLLLTKEPNAPVGTPLSLTAGNFGSVTKTYIHTTDDKALSYSVQQAMIAKTKVDNIFTMHTSHSPFLSQPDTLADILLTL